MIENPLRTARASRPRSVGVAVLALLAAPAVVEAQDPPADTTVYTVDPVVVTATRGERPVSEIPRPVSVLQLRDFVDGLPNTVPELFRNLPGLDVTGVGVSQVRPQIRGQGGQRLLLLNDGLRMNNTRRQRDFGELAALVNVDAVEQVEVVRGPASVLYGSDAIAGVVNIINRVPREEGYRGSASYLFGSVEGQSRVTARVSGRSGAFSVQGGGMWRTADPYEAPSGDFGEITLANDVVVGNSGVEDANADLRLGWDLNPSVGVFAKVEHYRSDDSGFGVVDPAEYAPGDAEIAITYPTQRFSKVSTGLRARELDVGLADEVNVQLYGQDNERDLVFDALIPFGPTAGLELDNRNFTDIRTYGGRAEARKLVGGDVLLTYGADGFRDDAVGTDNNTSTMFGFGPPMVTFDDTPSLPDAQLTSLGAFLQAEAELGDRVSLVAGGRFQSVSAETFATAGLSNTPRSESNSTGVWAANALVEITPELDLVASTGRGFRSPNLVELFFDGAVPEGSAYQIAAEDLGAETSLNVDVGARYQSGPLFVEGFYFRNKISDGIRSQPVLDGTGAPVEVQGLDAYQNTNVDEIVLKGVELNAELRLDNGIVIGSTVSTLDAEDAIDPDNPVGESYASKVTGRVGYRDPVGRFFGEWSIRRNGEQKDAVIGSGNPLGAVLPSFTVQSVRGGVRLIETGSLSHGVTVVVSNLTNTLYAESANAAFFRPEPKRNLTVSWTVSF